MSRVFCAILLSTTALLSNCGGGHKSAPPTPPPAPPPTASSTIKHIVIIMQENRTFDNLFNGFPGADTVASGMSNGVSVPLQAVPYEQGTDLDHSHEGWYKDYDNGKMDGFAHAASYPIPKLPYAFVPQSETAPIWTLAKAYTLGDRMFQSNTGPSFVAHQYLIAGQSAEADNNPDENGVWGCDSAAKTTVTLIGPNGTSLPGPYPCFDYQTMADLLDAKGISWRYYAAAKTPDQNGDGYIWSAYDAIKHIRFGADWATNVISPPPTVLTDIQNGKLAQVTWITPSTDYSDHAGPGATAMGPDWVASITNTIGTSQYWDSTAIFITWDDWGGWYDHVPSPMVDNMGLGFRVPLIIVSPFANHGYISHTVHEPSGFLKYTEEVFNLPSLGTRDTTADDFSDCFNYSQTPQPYTQIPVTFTPKYFQSLKASTMPDDD
jgi:phospholipase C